MDQLELAEGELFVSDLGQEQNVTIADQPITVGRYAVIRNAIASKQLQVVEVGADLEYLLAKYQISKDSIGRINR